MAGSSPIRVLTSGAESAKEEPTEELKDIMIRTSSAEIASEEQTERLKATEVRINNLLAGFLFDLLCIKKQTGCDGHFFMYSMINPTTLKLNTAYTVS